MILLSAGPWGGASGAPLRPRPGRHCAGGVWTGWRTWRGGGTTASGRNGFNELLNHHLRHFGPGSTAGPARSNRIDRMRARTPAASAPGPRAGAVHRATRGREVLPLRSASTVPGPPSVSVVLASLGRERAGRAGPAFQGARLHVVLLGGAFDVADVGHRNGADDPRRGPAVRVSLNND